MIYILFYNHCLLFLTFENTSNKWRWFNLLLFVIIALFNTRCFVVVATFVWWITLKIGRKRLVFPLLVSPTRQGTLSFCFFWLKGRSFKKYSQNVATSFSLRLFYRISLQYCGFGGVVEPYEQNAPGETNPITLSLMTCSMNFLSLTDQHNPPFTSIKLKSMLIGRITSQ